MGFLRRLFGDNTEETVSPEEREAKRIRDEQKEAQRLAARHKLDNYYPHETDLYIPLQHCGVRADLLAECVLCTRYGYSFWPNPGQWGGKLDTYYALWRCPTCGDCFERSFEVATKSGALQAIESSFVITSQIPRSAAEAIKLELQRCPMPMTPHQCHCAMHERARKKFIGDVWSEMMGRAPDTEGFYKNRKTMPPYWRFYITLERDRGIHDSADVQYEYDRHHFDTSWAQRH